jgi:hypothetical protein
MAGTSFYDLAGILWTMSFKAMDANTNILPAPMKLYLPIVSVVAALSKRNDNFDFDLWLVNTVALRNIQPQVASGAEHNSRNPRIYNVPHSYAPSPNM